MVGNEAHLSSISHGLQWRRYNDCDMIVIDIWADGACSGNPGPGGHAALLVAPNGQEKIVAGFDPATTNNRMELMGVIAALQSLTRSFELRIHMDSKYVVDAFEKGWIRNWQRNNWRKADKQPVKNRDLWELLLNAMEPHQITWVKVKGHSSDRNNNRVDEIAVRERKRVALA
jgi:ribonuclease HI